MAVGQRPDGGSHEWLMWACERRGTPARVEIPSNNGFIPTDLETFVGIERGISAAASPTKRIEQSPVLSSAVGEAKVRNMSSWFSIKVTCNYV